MKNIIEFEVGDDIQSFFIIKDLNLKTSSNNKKYFDMTLSDKTGQMNSKVWDIKDEMIDLYKTGAIVKVKGVVTLWQNNKQLKISKIRLKNDADNVDINELVPSAPIEPSLMYKEIFELTDLMENNDVKKLVQYFLTENKEKLMYYPAAKSNHHSIRAGLLYHILRMLKVGKGLVKVYPNIDSDLLYAGIILHDMEKINEMISDEMGIVSSYSFNGQLLGHLIMGIKKVDEAAKKLNVDEEISSLIQHMILSHHYEPEFGSPKKPLIPEGELLHYIDMIDARMYDMDKALSSVDTGEFTDGVYVLDRRRLYKSKFNK
ncbi:3'-5' exoribonuclease YhaM family protein [Helicovermis profundi]|uniref:3'-5' exoribonuclease YhaM family protein n=1 Tax=Helicovermis profundi TaxID=3065157 RepID=A0AAU9EAN6_9FIRM|nr:3'-5' exoribonuclease YhaM family protein [Clostridia bacterium S502]